MMTLADGRIRVDISLTMPDGYNEGEGPITVSLADLADLIDATPQLNKPDYRLSPTSSDTVPDQPLSRAGNATTYGASNFEGTVTVLRQTDASGKVDLATDTVFAAIGEKGARAFYFERTGPVATLALAAADEGWIYEAISDDPQVPTDRAGYIKNVIPLGIQSRRRFIVSA